VISICITVKNRSKLHADGRELALLPKCVESIVECVKPEDNVELVISDWHSDDWPLEEWVEEAAKPMPVKLVAVDGYFSRGRGLNIAFDNAVGDVLLFLDADMIACRGQIDKGCWHVAKGRAFFPICWKYTDPDHQHGKWIPAACGIVMIARDVFVRAGKWPELRSWGREDNQLHDAVKRIAPIVRERLPGLRHQWHPEGRAWKYQYADPECEHLEGAM
jgi:glycosyltransferase involved in cell wall biosynthesis